MFRKPVNVEDYRVLAQRRLPKIIFDYLEGGADDETGLKHNREVFDHYRLTPRRLVDVGSCHPFDSSLRQKARPNALASSSVKPFMR